MQDFPKSLGRPFIATVLRRVAEHFQAGASEWYASHGIKAPVKAAASILLLEEKGRPLAVTEIAGALRQAHPSTIQVLRELQRLQLVESVPCPEDRRRTLVSLTRSGRVQAQKIKAVQAIFARAYEQLCEETGVDPYPGILRIEEACVSRSMLERLNDAEAALYRRGPS